MATINDLVLVHLDRKPAFFARLNDLSPDVKRGWYQVELLVLSLPPQPVVWILEETQINGEEFTMGGRPVRLELIPPKPRPNRKPRRPRARARSFPWCGKPGRFENAPLRQAQEGSHAKTPRRKMNWEAQ